MLFSASLSLWNECFNVSIPPDVTVPAEKEALSAQASSTIRWSIDNSALAACLNGFYYSHCDLHASRIYRHLAHVFLPTEYLHLEVI